MNCRDVDELAAAYALGAVERHEERRIHEHLATCPEPHDEARGHIDAAAAIDHSVRPITPSAALRARLMATIASTPQEPTTAPAAARPAPVELGAGRANRVAPPRRAWWHFGPLPAAVAAVGLAVAVGLGAWNLNLNQQLAAREAALRTVAAADAAYAVSGSAGSGWVLESDGEALFLTSELAELPADRIYELWLIGPDGAPVAVGVVDEVEGLTAVALERGIDDAQVFAVTVEAERVDAPTSEPVLVASLEG